MSGSAVEHSLCAFTCQHLTICQTGDKPNIINTSVRSVEGVSGWGGGEGRDSKANWIHRQTTFGLRVGESLGFRSSSTETVLFTQTLHRCLRFNIAHVSLYWKNTQIILYTGLKSNCLKRHQLTLDNFTAGVKNMQSILPCFELS